MPIAKFLMNVAPAASSRDAKLWNPNVRREVRDTASGGSPSSKYARSWLHLLHAAAYGDASMQLHRTTCMARLSSACGVECTTLRRLAARTRAQHASRCDLRSRCGTVQRRGVHGRTVRFGWCCRVLSGGQKVAKTRVDVCRVFSSHVQTLQCVSLCTVRCRQLSPVAVYSCAVSRPLLWVVVVLRWRLSAMPAS